MLNGEHTVVESLDIFSKVGRGAAHDEYIPFTIKNNKLKVQGETSRFDGKVNVEFIKVSKKYFPNFGSGRNVNSLYTTKPF